ncbi:MAG: hypothetical protein Fur0020_11750 [Thermodesulfovibrionia bacterium]
MNQNMESIGNIIGRFSRDLGLEVGRRINNIRKEWHNLVGETIASHSYPAEIRGDLLILTVETPQWMHHLTFFNREITEKLEGFGIKRVRFRLGKLPPFPELTHKEKECLLSEEDKVYLDEVLSGIKDEGLRDGFRRLITHSLIKGRGVKD